MPLNLRLLQAGDMSVTEVCLAVGFTSLGSFSAQFRRLVGESPTAYRERAAQLNRTLARVPSCLQRKWTRPRVERFREADPGSASIR